MKAGSTYSCVLLCFVENKSPCAYFFGLRLASRSFISRSTKIVIFAFILLVAGRAHAATECICRSSGYVYQTRDGNDMGYPSYAYTPRVLSSTVYYVSISTSLCRIDDVVWGYVVAYSTLNNCPADEGLMLALDVGLGAVF